MANYYWDRLTLRNGDQVMFIPAAPEGERLGGVTENERNAIGHISDLVTVLEQVRDTLLNGNIQTAAERLDQAIDDMTQNH